ncbi:CDP-diacylglycerol--glycerol-3-phosphate 3-phosphatidyltransferase [bacterium]|nr:CDP-diacylglycerol--glycerol-3-phosphate 3-phosphatidyltransferase [bacterium]
MSLPNQLTVLRIVLTPIFGVLLTFEALHYKYIAFSVFVLASLTDWYDGYIARKYGNITPTGKYLDPLADKLLISTTFGVFVYLGHVEFWMFLVIALRDILITALRSYAISTNKPFATSHLAKWKTAFQMFAIYLILIWMVAEGQPQQPTALAFIAKWKLRETLMWLVTFFTIATGVSYMYVNRGHLKSFAIACYRVFVPTNVR